MKIKIIAHTHWDREWYFTHFKSRVYSYVMFDEIIDFLSKNENFSCFVLDGQTSIIEEYLKFRPKKKEKLKNLVGKKRLLTGPWFTQTDSLVVSGESIVRNLLYGNSYSKKLGHTMEIGYLPDSFGMSEQLPQIYNGFNIKYTMFRRGIADSISKDREFYWYSPDGSKVFAHNIYHYGSMAYPPEDENKIEEYMEEMLDKLSESSKTGILVLFNGEDQKPIRKNLLSIIRKMNQIGMKKGVSVELSSPEELMRELESSSYEFDEYQGELTFGQHSRTHKSIFSTRYDLKQKNNYLENYLTNNLEPLMTLGYMLGLEYEDESVKYIWKKMLENAAHDSIGMCNSDLTNMFIGYRFEDAYEFSRNLIELKMREISMRIPSKNIFQFQVYNLLTHSISKKQDVDLYLPAKNFILKREDGSKIDYDLKEIKDVTEDIFKLSVREAGVAGNIDALWIKKCKKIYLAKLTLKLDDLKPFSYETISIEQDEEKAIDLIDKTMCGFMNNEFIENSFFKIEVLDGKINLQDKRNGQEYHDFIRIQDDGDEGDSYDYSKPSKDWAIKKLNIIDTKVREDKFYSYLTVSGMMMIPKDLQERAERISSSKMKIKLEIRLDKESTMIKTRVKLINPSIEHRVRLVVNSKVRASYSIADEQFGTIFRPLELNYPTWKEDGFNERPRTIEPLMSYCAIQDERTTLQVLTDDVREYQIIGDSYNEIAMTIFRSTPYLGKEELNDRPGRASGNTSETFDTRYIGSEINAEYYINLCNEKESLFKLGQKAKEIFTQVLYYQGAEFKNNTEHLVLNNIGEKNLKLSQSFIEYKGRAILSTIKKEEDGNGIILRYFNPDNSHEEKFKDDLLLKANLSNSKISQVKLDEKTIISDEIAKKIYKPCQVKTFKLSLDN